MDLLYNGKPSKGVDSINLLMESEEFNIQMGKLTLAAGRLEAELIFTELIDETMLPKNDLIDADVLTYAEKAWETRKNLIGLADLISKY